MLWGLGRADAGRITARVDTAISNGNFKKSFSSSLYAVAQCRIGKKLLELEFCHSLGETPHSATALQKNSYGLKASVNIIKMSFLLFVSSFHQQHENIYPMADACSEQKSKFNLFY